MNSINMLNYFALAILLLSISCSRSDVTPPSSEPAIVEVGGKKLYPSQLAMMIHPEISSMDSIAIANAFVDQWIREQLLLREAFKNFSSDFAIEAMVEDYRQQLIKNKFEQQLISRRLDTIVTTNQLETYYEKNKEQYLLPEPLIRCILIRTPQNYSSTRQIQNELSNYSSSNQPFRLQLPNIEILITPDNWHLWSELSISSKDFSINRAKQLSLQEQSDKESKYFLKVLELKDEKTPAPLQYIEAQLKMMIVHQRKQKVLDDLKQELYEKALESNVIKIN